MNKSEKAVDIFNERALGYQSKYMDVSRYHQLLDLLCELITTKNAKILELACGPGNITNYLLSQRPDFRIDGSDLSQNMLDLAKIYNPTAQFSIMDMRDLNQIEDQYDAIVCGFGFPYLNKEEVISFIEDSSRCLKEKGILFFSTMEDRYENSSYATSSSGEKILFTYYHELAYLAAALENCSFEVVYNERKDIEGEDVVKDLMVIGRRR